MSTGTGELQPFYCCSVESAPRDAQIHPGASYRFNMKAPSMQAPSRPGQWVDGVATGTEIEELRKRGFEISLRGGPFETEQEADDCLDSAWDFSSNLESDEDSGG